MLLAACMFPPESALDGEIPKAAPLDAIFSNTVRYEEPVLNVYDVSAGKIVKMGIEEYVAGVVLAEMPVSYDFEALKAQAVAARSYALNKCSLYSGTGCQKHETADVCTSSGCCQGFSLGEGIELARRAAKDTRGEICALDGEPIFAMYHASAGGHTEDAENVYAEAFSYLRGVWSRGEEAYPQYSAVTEYTFEQLQSAFKADADVILSSDIPLEDQFEILARADTGRVSSVRVGLAQMDGSKFRRRLSLRSANFTMHFFDGGIAFKTIGFGHGVGMSQTGADAMAKNGSTYKDILNWYYTGVELITLPYAQII